MGLEFLCAGDINEYIEKSVTIARDKDLLNALHLGLRNMFIHSNVMNVEEYMSDYEEHLIKTYLKFIS